jgi:hypothetical protein
VYAGPRPAIALPASGDTIVAVSSVALTHVSLEHVVSKPLQPIETKHLFSPSVFIAAYIHQDFSKIVMKITVTGTSTV